MLGLDYKIRVAGLFCLGAMLVFCWACVAWGEDGALVAGADESAGGGVGVESLGQNIVWPGDAAIIGPADAGFVGESAGALRVVYFYSSTCSYCDRVNDFLPRVEARWGGRIVLERRCVRVDKMTEFMRLVAYEEHYASQENILPKVFVGGQYLAGAKAVVGRLDAVIGQELAWGGETFVPQLNGEVKGRDEIAAKIVARFEGFRGGAIALAGLLDGINPCAFTTIVFLLSMLAYLGKSRRELAVIGSGFTAGVFVTYLLLGLGLLGAVKTFSADSGLSRAFVYVVAGLTFVLAAWSLWDYIRFKRTGDVKSATLGLPKSVKLRINRVIRVGLSTRGLVVGSLSVGALVAVLESLCTGQVYLPTIVFMARTSGPSAELIWYLVLYNIMFILPLVVLLTIGCLGVTSQRLGNILRNNLGTFKLIMAALFTALGILVLATA